MSASDFTIQVDEPNVFSVTEQPAANVTVAGGGGVISSVFGRIGAIAALAGDYAAFYAPLSVSGTVTTVSVSTANGVSGSVANPTTTPAITLTLGAITPTTVNGNTITTGTGTLTLSTFALTASGTASVSGTNTGDQTNISGNAATVTTNANLTGPITSSGNATSIASQTGTGTTFVVDSTPTIATPSFTTGFTIGGAAASGKIPIGNGTNYVASTPTYPNAAGSAGNVLRSDATNFLSAQLNSADISPALVYTGFKITAVNFNSGNTDNAINIVFPTGYTRWLLSGINICHPSTTMSTATFGFFTAAAGGGTALITPSPTTVSFTSTAENTAGNLQIPTRFAAVGTTTFNVSTIYFRIVNAQGGAATADVNVFINFFP